MKNMESIKDRLINLAIAGYNGNSLDLKTIVFRFDDISVNEDPILLAQITEYIHNKFQGNVEVIFGLSPLAHSNCGKRVFPKLFNAMSDYRNFYTVDKIGKPEITNLPIQWAGHGIVHVDHRLLDKQAQEMSILISCSLAGNNIFVPPWNKWNKDTEDICAENNIALIKFEHGWKSCEYNTFDKTHNLWYLHGYAWTLESFKNWIENANN